jgi:mono/diheme cytochrome c family protein
VAYLQALGRGRRDVWAEWRSAEPEVPPPPAPDPSRLGRGAELYVRLCASCHGEAGDGRGAAAGLLSTRPRDFVAGHYRFKSTGAGEGAADADLYRSITLGSGTGAPMPSFYWLAPADRWALVARLKEFSPRLAGGGPSAGAGSGAAGRAPAGGPDRRGGPAPGGDASRLPEGRRLWDDLGCASCHGGAGEGMTREEAGAGWSDADGAPVPRTGSLRHACALRGGASPEAIARALLLGVGTAMPSYGEALVDPRARRALVAYVLSLQEPAIR